MNIVYDSFGGRYSDNPRAIYEALLERGGHEHVWVADAAHAATFPAGVETVAVGTPQHVAALESADAVVANAHVYVDWTRRPGAIHLQTWHGTPLKRIHADAALLPDEGFDAVAHDIASWTHLVSANPDSSRILPRAFGFTGELLETGYPRNDLLSAPDREQVRARARRELGIADGRTAVLYTPTWRDDLVDDEGALEFALQLDVDDFVARLGDDHVLLLRMHYFLAHRIGQRYGDQVLDVSSHPDVRELYLAADAMVTDYSSTMFDFAVTGKPLLFFTYDLEHYRDTLRGFYLDLETEAPGPVVRTSSELVDALLDLDAATGPYAERYAAFRERYTALEDGRATERVVDAVFGPAGDAARLELAGADAGGRA